jgi:hypothetical protein
MLVEPRELLDEYGFLSGRYAVSVTERLWATRVVERRVDSALHIAKSRVTLIEGAPRLDAMEEIP